MSLLDEYFESLRKSEEILDYQLTKFKNKFDKNNNFVEFVEKVIEKYDSDEYINRWYKRHIFPPEDLFWFLFSYAEKFGREADQKEYQEFGNMFTSSMFFINGYYFNLMNGQGSVIKVIKKV